MNDMSLAIMYTKRYEKVDYGPDHPFRKERFINFINILKEIRPKTKILEPRNYDLSILELVHSKEYIEHVAYLSERGYGMLSIDTPVFPGIFDWAITYCWGSLTAIDLVIEGKYKVAFNPCGGLHHAKINSDGGFCVFNDVALVAMYGKKRGEKIAIVDIDAHAGDGTMRILYREDILKISIHEDPRYLYPGEGFIHQVGEGNGYGYTINIPLPPNSTDDVLIDAFNKIVIPAIRKYHPTILVLQAGVDGYYLDPLTHLNYTSYGYREVARMIKELKIPTVVLGGGGYYLNRVPLLWLNIILTLIGEEKKYLDRIQVDLKPSKCQKNICIESSGVIEKVIRDHPFFNEL